MSRFKLFAFIALITLTFGVALISDALAGEKFKFRAAWYNTKFEPYNVPGEEGRIVFVFEDRGILTTLQGSRIFDGMAAVDVGFGDLDKTGKGFGQGTVECTDRDGDKIYMPWEAKVSNGSWQGPGVIVRGTGKFEGLKGKATHGPSVRVSPNQIYTEWEGELERPR